MILWFEVIKSSETFGVKKMFKYIFKIENVDFFSIILYFKFLNFIF